jgi:hypothetical protein
MMMMIVNIGHEIQCEKNPYIELDYCLLGPYGEGSSRDTVASYKLLTVVPASR